jgi:outer membrane protein assembly factor BamB
MMRNLRFPLVSLAALALGGAAHADFDGPAPLAWRFLQPTTVAPSGAPLVVGDTVYSAIGGRVFAVDKATGNLKWRYPQLDPIPGSFRSAPIFKDGLILAAGDNKIVYAIDAASGQPRWSFNSPAPVTGQPVLIGDYFVYSQSDSKLTALDTSKGKAAWGAPLGVLDGIVGQIAVNGTDVLVFTTRGELRSINTLTQKTTWRRPFDSVPPGSVPVVYGDSIFVNSGTYLVALSAANGTPRWQLGTKLQLSFSPAVSADGILVVSNDGSLMMYDSARKPLMKQPIALGSLPVVQPTAAGSMFIVPTANGAINLVDPKKGTIDWSYVITPLADAVAANPNAAGNGNMPGGGGVPGGGGGGLGGGGQTTTTIEKPLWVQAAGPATIAGNTLLISAKDGSILAFDRDLGVDLTPPTVKLLFPNSGDQVSGQPPLVLVFKIDDEASGVKPSTISIEIDGEKYVSKREKDGNYSVRFSQTGENKLLSDGRKVITVTVSDWLQNQKVAKFALTIDNSLRPIILPGTANPNGLPGGNGGLGGGAGGKGGGEGGGGG